MKRKALTTRQQLDNLADSLVEDIMALSDEEILAEAREDGIDIEQNTRVMQAIFEKAVQRARTARNTRIAERFNLG